MGGKKAQMLNKITQRKKSQRPLHSDADCESAFKLLEDLFNYQSVQSEAKNSCRKIITFSWFSAAIWLFQMSFRLSKLKQYKNKNTYLVLKSKVLFKYYMLCSLAFM